eukprot:GEMP01023133.1.p1 GENE.GEMP01023133.1~~GEMP01023133.1.p1  ORF type:complete len:685 (+),score=180.22 GEMP01023133.1:161-2215(+)
MDADKSNGQAPAVDIDKSDCQEPVVEIDMGDDQGSVMEIDKSEDQGSAMEIDKSEDQGSVMEIDKSGSQEQAIDDGGMLVDDVRPDVQSLIDAEGNAAKGKAAGGVRARYSIALKLVVGRLGRQVKAELAKQSSSHNQKTPFVQETVKRVFKQASIDKKHNALKCFVKRAVAQYENGTLAVAARTQGAAKFTAGWGKRAKRSPVEDTLYEWLKGADPTTRITKRMVFAKIEDLNARERETAVKEKREPRIITTSPHNRSRWLKAWCKMRCVTFTKRTMRAKLGPAEMAVRVTSFWKDMIKARRGLSESGDVVVYNMDETPILVDSCAGELAAAPVAGNKPALQGNHRLSKEKHTVCITLVSKSGMPQPNPVTAFTCATGGKNLQREMEKQIKDNPGLQLGSARFMFCKKGMMTMENMRSYVDILKRDCGPIVRSSNWLRAASGWIIWLIDAYAVHRKFAQDNADELLSAKITPVLIPPSTTPLLQPVDTHFNAHFKRRYKESQAVDELRALEAGQEENPDKISLLKRIKESHSTAMASVDVDKAFKNNGITCCLSGEEDDMLLDSLKPMWGEHIPAWRAAFLQARAQVSMTPREVYDSLTCWKQGVDEASDDSSSCYSAPDSEEEAVEAPSTGTGGASSYFARAVALGGECSPRLQNLLRSYIRTRERETAPIGVKDNRHMERK